MKWKLSKSIIYKWIFGTWVALGAAAVAVAYLPFERWSADLLVSKSLEERQRDDTDSQSFVSALEKPDPTSTLPDPNGLVRQAKFDRGAILADHLNRIDDAFTVPPELKERVGFWFDVYTKYNSHQKILHHSLFPWVIFKIVDTEQTVEGSFPRREWMRKMTASAIVDHEISRVKRLLKKISRGVPGETEEDRTVPAEAPMIVTKSLAPRAKSSTKPSKDDLPEVDEVELELHLRAVLQALAATQKSTLAKEAKRALNELRVQTGQRDFFAGGLEVSPRYLPTMEAIFRNSRLPIELTRLPLVESSFNKHATSKVGAAGIWQFMGDTGKKFMLVNSFIDERRSPFKATEGAARLLAENFLILGRSWPLAVTAWNHGPNGVRKAMNASGSSNLGVMIDLYQSKRFSFASENFYTEFLAALHAERYQDSIFPDIRPEAPLRLAEVRLRHSVKIAEFLEAASLTKEEFMSLNPDLDLLIRKKGSLSSGLRILVPEDRQDLLRTKLAGEIRLLGPSS